MSPRSIIDQKVDESWALVKTGAFVFLRNFNTHHNEVVTPNFITQEETYMDNYLVLLDAKDVQKAITKGIVKGILAGTAMLCGVKIVLSNALKKYEENKKASEVEEVTAPDEE